MIEFKQFVAARILEIKAEIDALPPGSSSERNADSLGIDIAFYETGLEVFQDFEDERAHSHLQQSRAFTARLDRAGMGRAHESEAKRF